MSTNPGMSPRMSLAMAMTVLRGCQEYAAERGHTVTVSVVDAAGRLMLTVRGDGTGFFTPETSRGKAVAAAGFRRRTSDLDREAGSGFFAAVPALLTDQILTSPGGAPLLLEGGIIGAVGVGGAPAEVDQECADAGAELLVATYAAGGVA
ncbi:MAG: heme-binding protein [Nocardioides sp.]|uniref:GlcG/HbpS family heme-binding protein n=1 Tax=Nocardioides sp. TaxID=35761 RepID=UPI0039E253C7